MKIDDSGVPLFPLIWVDFTISHLLAICYLVLELYKSYLLMYTAHRCPPYPVVALPDGLIVLHLTKEVAVHDGIHAPHVFLKQEQSKHIAVPQTAQN